MTAQWGRHFKPERTLRDLARRVFSRLLQGGEGDSGPRWQSASIALRTAGYLLPWRVQDRRDEEGRPSVLVLADVSGSMSAVSSQMLALAAAIQDCGLPGGDLLAVAQSNGWPQEQRLPNGEIIPIQIESGDEAVQWCLDLIRRHNVRAIVLAADWDGAWLCRVLADQPGITVYWLDPWSCRNLAVRVVRLDPAKNNLDGWSSRAIHQTRYAIACGNAKDALDALQEMWS